MADENNALLLKDKKRVYLFNTKSTVHEYVGGLIVDQDDPLMAGQTEMAPTANADHQYWNGTAWVSEVVITYEIKADQSLGLITRHPQGYTLQANETFTKPVDGLYEPKWNGSTWVGISAEEYFKQHPVAPTKPTQSQVAMAGVLKDVAGIKASDKTQDTLNAGIMKDLANTKIQLASQSKINAQLMKDIAALKVADKQATTTQN